MMMTVNQSRGERTLKTTFVAISDTVKTARELLLTSSLFHQTSSHLTTDKQMFSCFRHDCHGGRVIGLFARAITLT